MTKQEAAPRSATSAAIGAALIVDAVSERRPNAKAFR